MENPKWLILKDKIEVKWTMARREKLEVDELCSQLNLGNCL